MPESSDFHVLTVCTGNICRSPAVERLLAQGLGPYSGVRVSSAGVGAVTGAPIAPLMAELLDSVGAATDGFEARQVTESLLRSADLVLPLTRAHRSKVVELAPAIVRRTFTVREFARLAAAVDPAALPPGSPAERLRALVPLAAAQRGTVPTDPLVDDVVDPWGGPESLYDQSFAELAPAVHQIVQIVRG